MIYSEEGTKPTLHRHGTVLPRVSSFLVGRTFGFDDNPRPVSLCPTHICPVSLCPTHICLIPLRPTHICNPS